VPEQRDIVRGLNLLGFLESGSIIISANGSSVLAIEATERRIDLELPSLTELGVNLSTLLEGGHSLRKEAGSILDAERTAKGLHGIGWKLTLSERGENIASLGYGVSRLTGYISLNPRRLKNLAELFR
jgi:hypothetical protein